MKVFSNSSPLIYLSKIGRLELLKNLFKEVIIPEEVYEEVVGKGRNERFLDALKVESAVKEGWIKVKNRSYNRETENFGEIDEGESVLISIAKKERADLVLIDDASARIVAESFGLNVKGTIYILLLGCKKKILDKEETKELIKGLIEAGFKISAEIYAEVLDEMKRL